LLWQLLRVSGTLIAGLRTFAGNLVSTHSVPPTATTQLGQRPQPTPCNSCPPPSAKRIYAPAIELREAETCEIVLNSRSPNPIDVTPIFYTINGDAVVGNLVSLQPAEIRFVPVEQLMPEALRGRHRWGGIALSYTGNVLEVWAQITFHGVGGGSVDETFNVLEEHGSDAREAVWLMPKKSTAVIALGNSSDTAIRTTAQFSDGDSEDVDIPAGATKFIRRQARQRDTESVKLTTAGPAGSMRVTGFIIADDDSFTSSIRFYDTKKAVQPNLYAVNLRLKNTASRMVLKNTSDADVIARPRFFSAAGEHDNPVDLPAMTLRPQQVVDVDLSALRAAASSRTDLDSVSVQVLNNGEPGSLIGAAYSKERASQLTYDVPLRDSGKNRNGTGSYPWRIDKDYSTVVTVTNIGNQPAPFQVEIRYPGGPYSLGRRELSVGETMTFDLRRMRDEQQPDRLGKTLPQDLDRGQFHWSISVTPNEPKIIGRAEVVSRSGRVTSSYSCPTCCPDSGPAGHFDPNAYGLSVDGFVYTNAHGDYYDCYGNFYAGSFSWLQMWTYDPGIATVGSEARLNGIGVGDTNVVGQYDTVDYYTDGMDCYRSYGSASDQAPVSVLAAPDRLEVLSDTGQEALAACPSIIRRRIIYQVIDASGAAVSRTVNVREAFSNQTTNTCGNGQPAPSSCGPTNSAGQTEDVLSITCAGQSGAQSNPSCGFTQIQRISTCSPNAITELSFASHSIKANQVLVNTTTQFSVNTILPK